MRPTAVTRFLVTAILSCAILWPLAGLISGVPGVEAASAQTSEEVAFERGSWLYYLAPGEKQPRKLVRGSLPALSPDGKKLVYALVKADGTAGNGLMQLDLATGESSPLVPPSPTAVNNAAWSPQGDFLAYIYDAKDIVVMDAAGAGPRKIFSVPGGAYVPPAWTADGKSLFINDLDNLFQIDLNGRVLAKTPLTTFTGKAAAVTSTDRFVPNPRDPQLFAFTMAVEGTPQFTRVFNEPNTAMFLYDTRTRKRTRLTPADMLASFPSWSRDGNNLYFCGYREPNYKEKDPFRIYRINRDGTGLIMLTMGQNPNLSMAGSPQTPESISSPTGQAGTPPPASKESEALPPPPPMPE